MSEYGQILDAYEPDKEKMYKDFDDYFNHPIMVKIKDVNNHSMYMCKMYCLLSNQCRYIVVFLEQDKHVINSKHMLKSLRWKSLQTRTLSDQHKLPAHGYQPKREGPLNSIITRTSVNKEASVYSCNEYPITITLLLDENDNNREEYKDRGNIIAALETYSTVITINI
jgi:hypothetical protein